VLLAEPEASNFSFDRIFSRLNGLTRVALAVSGGSDSIAMFRMVHEWAPASLEIFALTVDHGLRVAAADEAAQVKRWCCSLGVRCEILKWQGGPITSGIQAKARQARYDLMSVWCLANQVEVLLTAHTADDQAETVLMRKLRTSTAKSLSGIWPERDWNGVRVLRPLLGLRRAELRAYLNQCGQAWIDDPSNEDMKFERVRMRHELAGQTLGLVDQAHLAQQVSLRHAFDAKAWCLKHIQRHELGFVSLPHSLFDQLQTEVKDEILLEVLSLVGIGGQPELLERRNLLAWLADDGGSRRALGGLLFAKRKREMLVGREPGRISDRPVMIPEVGEIVWDDRFRVTGPVGAQIVATGSIAGVPRQHDIPAFIQAGLPAVLMADGGICVPSLSFGAGATCKYMRY
jgi:tRNA(Ile)-lysidine synthase